MMYCRICGAKIEDAGVLISQGLQSPKLCEPCRRRVRSYRAKTVVRHECERALLVKLGDGFVNVLRYEGEAQPGSVKGWKSAIYSIGGPGFGPWGGARYSGKYLVYFKNTEPLAGASYLMRIMKKTALDCPATWIYLVFEPLPEGEREPTLIVDFKFIRVWKTTLKGFGRQFDEYYPIEEPHEELLSGWCKANTGRFGNNWIIYVKEERQHETKESVSSGAGEG